MGGQETDKRIPADKSLLVVFGADGGLQQSTLPPHLYEAAEGELRGVLPALAHAGELKFRLKLQRSLWEIRGLHLPGAGSSLFLFERMGPAPRPNDYSIRFENEQDWKMAKDSIWFDGSAAIEEVLRQIRQYGRNMTPVFIAGEIGTGKNIVANELYKAFLAYKKQPDWQRPLMIIDCILMTEKKWRWLLESSNSEFMDTGHVIYMKNVEVLSVPFIKKLHEFFKDGSIYACNKIIFSYSCPNSDKEPDEYGRLFANNFGCLKLELPTLRSRREDLPRLIDLCRLELQRIYKQNIPGFEQDAVWAMQQFYWEDNLEQFKRAMEQLVLRTEHEKVTGEEVAAMLRREAQRSLRSVYGINMQQNLERITRDIILLVLREENMNQSKAAKRLGIGRSTMWRKIRGEG
ncbi:MAG: Response regulator containing CheY-like receiver, AAA-type ATPase, and DNA-binding domain [Paenibacillaceae bacterium]|nr:Response regulator containing CheY-like receiver, AAA-type ATPase, and DNA-binding domain [Paenibacillaceae bacterium]